MSSSMKFVTSLAFSPTPHLCAIARAAEEADFDAVGISDHVVHPEKIGTPYPYTPDGAPRWEPFTEWPDPWVAIGAMAAVTERLRFFTSIYVLPMRNPFLVAKTIATAAVLSDNRVALGIGSGWMREEFDLMQQPFRRRGKRMDEMIAVMRLLWSGGMVEHHGELYDFDRLEMTPSPSQPIPIYVGGISDRALRRAATTADGWISDLHTTAELEPFLAKLRAYRADSPRANDDFHTIVSVSDAYDLDGYRRLAETGVTHMQTMPWIFYGAANDDADAKRDGIRRFGEDIIDKM
jgi:probable F420-dependent oxidoreductase